MHHQGQRASEAVRNSTKYSTCILHIQLHPSFPCHKVAQTITFWSASYVISYGYAGKGVYTTQ